MNESHQIVQNIGNFSVDVLPGMIAYGREKSQGRGKLEASAQLPGGDGYATKEADIVLGGFLHTQAAQHAIAHDTHLSQLSVQEQQTIVLQLCREHIEKHGTANQESHAKWLKRVEAYAKHHHLKLPPKGERESGYDYSRRLIKWTAHQPQPWPKRRAAVATHLVLSPEPRYWEKLRAAGLDERQFLRSVLTSTMKEFSDWRRKQHGPGHTLGWTAGTHVERDGADRHPHIHLVVLKRDQAGREVDWSVASLKGRHGRQEPDPLREIKRCFEKHVEKAYARCAQPDRDLTRQVDRQPATTASRPGADTPADIHRSPRLSDLSRNLRVVGRAMQPFLPRSSMGNEIGAMLRMVGMIQRATAAGTVRTIEPQLTFANIRASIAAIHAASLPQLQPGD